MSSSNKKHIVIVSTWFPPQQSVAVNRIVSFIKYLDKNKFDVSVITLHTENALEKENLYNSTIYRLKVKSFLTLPNFTTKSSRVVHYLKVIKKLFILNTAGSNLSKWEKKAKLELEILNKNKKIDLIISSYSPIEAHQIASNFCSNHKNTKWIADMRDEFPNQWISPEKKGLALIDNSDAITTISQPHVELFKRDLSKVQNIELIRNGFNHEQEFKDSHFNSHFTISYLGTFYGDIKPNSFLKAISELKQEKKIPTGFRISFVGCQRNFSIPQNIKENLFIEDRVSQEESINKMRESDINLLILPKNERKGVYSGKIFDYISVQKPILAIVDKTDVAASLIQETNAGFIADFNNLFEIKEAIIDCYNLWENKQTIPFKNVHLLHRKIQVKKLETLIDNLFNEKNNSNNRF